MLAVYRRGQRGLEPAEPAGGPAIDPAAAGPMALPADAVSTCGAHGAEVLSAIRRRRVEMPTREGCARSGLVAVSRRATQFS